MPVEDSGTWPNTVEIGGQRGRVVEGKRLEYEERREGNYEQLDNLKEVENLESLN